MINVTDQAEFPAISVRDIYARYRWRISFTWSVVLLESLLFLLFPLAMGYAIDSLLEDSYVGLVALTVLGLLTLAAGAARRFYDTRVYAGIYKETAQNLVANMRDRDQDVSTIAARTGLVRELVEFFEQSLPEIIASIIGLVGALAIILFLNMNVFLACAAATVLIGSIYALTSRKTYALNSGFNSELEEQVRRISESNQEDVAHHFGRLAKWQIRLSDLETANFSGSWILLMALLAYSIVAIIEGGAATQGRVFAVLMYVFNYIEAVVALPYFYQQLVRLQEISDRLR